MMAIPDEYRIDELVHKTDNVNVYQAHHPIHGTVTIYTPDEALSTELANTVRERLYQGGIRMQAVSQLGLPFVTRSLEISQNPNEPYIVTEYTKNNLQELIDDGVTLKPKRVFHILSQVLRAIMALVEHGWQMDRLNAHQIRLDDIQQGDATFTPVGTGGFQTITNGTMPLPSRDRLTNTLTLKTEKDSVAPLQLTQGIDRGLIEKTQTLKSSTAADGLPSGIEPTETLARTDTKSENHKTTRQIQKNIYTLGDIACQLLFATKYHRSDKAIAVDIRKLSSKWRTILDRALSPNIDVRYDSYEAMLRDASKALTRNKRIAIYLAPLILLGLIVGMYFGYKDYARRREIEKIMSSEPGQAIKTYLSEIDKGGDEFPELQEPSSSQNRDNAILSPFDETTGQQEQKN